MLFSYLQHFNCSSSLFRTESEHKIAAKIMWLLGVFVFCFSFDNSFLSIPQIVSNSATLRFFQSLEIAIFLLGLGVLSPVFRVLFLIHHAVTVMPIHSAGLSLNHFIDCKTSPDLSMYFCSTPHFPLSSLLSLCLPLGYNLLHGKRYAHFIHSSLPRATSNLALVKHSTLFPTS